MSVQELESEITRLSKLDLAAFAQWFEDFMADAWDTQIEADIAAGKLDRLGKQADEHFDAGRLYSPLNHFATPDYWFHYRHLPTEMCMTTKPAGAIAKTLALLWV